jgi:hypothetical protein
MVSRARQTLAFLLIFLLGQPYDAVATASATFSGACQQAYGAAISEGEVPDWLKVEDIGQNLATSHRLDLLAGELLQSSIVEGSVCPAFGLFPDGSPNGCGIEVSRDQVVVWQNLYDRYFIKYSAQNYLPARAMKALVTVESQFWPGADWQKGEIGLGQMTESGADLVLSWQADRYQEICKQVFDANTCAQPYQNLEGWQQAALQGYLLKSIDTTCATCPGGVDPGKGEQQIAVLAEAMVASCQQTNFVFRRATGSAPSAILSYEDFWLTVLANYHAGSGCLMDALNDAGHARTWDDIAAHFPRDCGSGAEYIRRIEQSIAP